MGRNIYISSLCNQYKYTYGIQYKYFYIFWSNESKDIFDVCFLLFQIDRVSPFWYLWNHSINIIHHFSNIFHKLAFVSDWQKIVMKFYCLFFPFSSGFLIESLFFFLHWFRISFQFPYKYKLFLNKVIIYYFI